MTLVLSSSLGTTAAMWAPLEAHLGGLATLAYEHRGHGPGPAPPGPYSLAELGGDVLALLDAQGVARASFCGVSLGGMVGMWLAAHHPERVQRLVLCCTAAHLDPGSFRERAALVRRVGTPAVVADAVVERWLTPDYAQRNPDVVDSLRAQLVATPAEGYAGCCEAIAGMDLRGDLGAIAAPTLCIAAREDLATPPEHLGRIAAAVPGARLEILSPAAHLAPVQRAQTVAALVLDHLRSDP